MRSFPQKVKAMNALKWKEHLDKELSIYCIAHELMCTLNYEGLVHEVVIPHGALAMANHVFPKYFWRF